MGFLKLKWLNGLVPRVVLGVLDQNHLYFAFQVRFGYISYLSHFLQSTFIFSVPLSKGPWMSNGGRSQTFKQSFECKGIHPYPLFFSSSQPLISEVKYLLSLRLLFSSNTREDLTEIPVETIWGFQGVPRIKTPWQDFFRWKQVYRRGLSSSVSSGQFPLLYFIK